MKYITCLTIMFTFWQIYPSSTTVPNKITTTKTKKLINMIISKNYHLICYCCQLLPFKNLWCNRLYWVIIRVSSILILLQTYISILLSIVYARYLYAVLCGCGSLNVLFFCISFSFSQDSHFIYTIIFMFGILIGDDKMHILFSCYPFYFVCWQVLFSVF